MVERCNDAKQLMSWQPGNREQREEPGRKDAGMRYSPRSVVLVTTDPPYRCWLLRVLQALPASAWPTHTTPAQQLRSNHDLLCSSPPGFQLPRLEPQTLLSFPLLCSLTCCYGSWNSSLQAHLVRTPLPRVSPRPTSSHLFIHKHPSHLPPLPFPSPLRYPFI